MAMDVWNSKDGAFSEEKERVGKNYFFTFALKANSIVLYNKKLILKH